MRKINYIKIVVVVIGLSISTSVSAREWIGTTVKKTKTNTISNRAANCAPASQNRVLEFNNASAYIENSGLLWYNKSRGKASYLIPKAAGTSPIYAGGLWMGGVDINKQLKLAAIRFRSTGNDFWPGPLSTIPGTGNDSTNRDFGPASIDPQTCADWDKFYVITRQEVEEFRAWYICSQTPGCTDFQGYGIPKSILEWPAHGDISKFQDYYIAPFYDNNNDGDYNPADGDYPWYDIEEEVDCRTSRQVTLFGDYTIWWIFNDKGNIHTESGGDPIGMEIRGQAFSFATNDEINDMTFYNYEMINRSTQTLYQTYFGQYVDADLGCAQDDYVGCDVGRGLGFAYNGDANDDNCSNGAIPYGVNPPAIGVDFFEGPYQDNNGVADSLFKLGSTNFATEAVKGNGIGYGDQIVDNERFGMRRFVYYNNGGGNTGDPSNQVEHYNYLKGLWKNGVKFEYGGNAYPAPVGTSTSGVQCDFMFPSDPQTGVNSDPSGWGTGGVTGLGQWDETTVGNAPADRRFVQSAGPFTLEPGALNNITVGVVYGRGTSGQLSSIAKLKQADDKAQSLFDNCFEILEGPDAPKLTIQELDKELILTINPYANGGDIEAYEKLDPTIDVSLIQPGKDNKYHFEGYQIFQLKDKTISASQIYDIDVSRLVVQYDIKNDIKQLLNYYVDPTLGVGVPQEMVKGTDEGIKHSLRVTEDLFAKGDKRIINHKTYYFMIIAYGQNEFKNYDPTDAASLDGQQKPYIASRKGYDGGEIQSYPGIPHIPSPEAGGTVINAQYGDGVEITRIEGMGNGGNELDLTPASRKEIAEKGKVDEVTYAAGKGPINVKVIDPLNLIADDFEVKFTKDAGNGLDSATWELKRISTGEVFNSKSSIALADEQIFPDFGFSITIEQFQYEEREVKTDPAATGGALEDGTHVLSWSIEYEDETKPWLSGLPDGEGNSFTNWIRSGTQIVDPATPEAVYNDYQGLDDEEEFEKIANGTFAPFRLMGPNFVQHAPIAGNSTAAGAIKNYNGFGVIRSVDVVYTKDKSLWSRCPVLETQDISSLAEGGVSKLKLRAGQSVDKNGNPAAVGSGTSNNPNDANFIGETGMGWFPGYVVDLETGERLNVAFGEDSRLANDNGRDMLFNPTSKLQEGLGTFVGGGKHYLYIFRNNSILRSPPVMLADPMGTYDEGRYAYSHLNGTTLLEQRFWRSCMWVGTPITLQGQEFLSTDAILKVRVATEYARYATKGNISPNNTAASVNDWYNLYKFDTRSVATGKGIVDSAKTALDLINVVPNPYYAYSNYEQSRLENRIKITNLPDKCTIKIYNIAGSLVRTFTKDDPITSLDWDLKNVNGVPIAGGFYIIHVNVPEVGEKIIKWFGALRPPDLTNF